MAGRASIVGAAATHVGKVREHNEDAHFFDADLGVFLVCDGMGGHAAGEVASAIAIRTIRTEWSADGTQKLIDGFMDGGSPDVKKQLLGWLRAGVIAAHDAIIGEARRDLTKKGMGTTLVGAVIVGNELVFAHAGDSRAYLVRDAIAVQLTEDHTLLARLLAAGIDVDQSGEGSRFKSMLTNALGIGEECKVSTFVVPLADGDRFLLCSDGISEYVPEHEVGEVLCKQPSPARAAQKLIELALERGGADNATAIVVRVLEAGETPQPAEMIKRDDEVIKSCALWSAKVTPQQRLRALRIAIARDHLTGERLPAYHLGDRVAWIIVEGQVAQGGAVLEAGTLLYPESLVTDSPGPDRDSLAVARTDVRALALRADDFRELCEDDAELAEVLLESLTPLISERAQVLHQARADRADRADTEHTETQDETQDAIANAHVKPEPPIEAPQQPPRPRRAQSPVSMELEQRFDAVTAPPIPGQRAESAPSTERVPLILSPRTGSDSIRPKTQQHDVPLAVPAPVIHRPPSEPEIETVLERRRSPSEPEIETVLELRRPPSEPEIETVLELDASMQKHAAPRSRPPTAPEIETVIEIEAEPGEEAEHAALAEAEQPVVRVIESEDARIVETITDTSSQTLTVTVTDAPELEIETTRAPSEPVTSEESVTASGTINGTSRAKRASEGWDE